jgi:hypothetical protein
MIAPKQGYKPRANFLKCLRIDMGLVGRPEPCTFLAACVVAPRCSACLKLSALECASSASGSKLP